jgi:regulator of protease activity HflC (stomatin/prohibitin superfamily)
MTTVGTPIESSAIPPVQSWYVRLIGLLHTLWRWTLKIGRVMLSIPRYILRKIANFILDKLPYFILLFLLMLLIIIFFWPRIFVSIHAGEAGVLYDRFGIGTVVDYVYPEGFHVVNPFNVMNVYNTRVQIILHDFTVLTKTGLPIELKIAVRFQPIYELVGVLHQEVGPEYPDKIILPQIESVLRRNIGQYTPEDIYTNKRGILTNIITLALEEVGRKYVIVDDIIIRTVQLPRTVETSIEQKLIEEQRYKTYEFILAREKEEAERKLIEAKGIRDYQAVISETLSPDLLRWQGIQATRAIAESENAKVVVIGNGEQGLPIILGAQ